MKMAGLHAEKLGTAASTTAEEARVRQAYARRALSAQTHTWFDAGHLFMVQQLERRLVRALRLHNMLPLQSKKILEIGCGHGYWLREFVKWGASPDNLAGIDLLDERVDQARRLSAADIAFQSGNAARLDFADDTFDIVLQATVFTSIRDFAVKQQVAAEMLRVLEPRGIVLWYDFHVDNPRNRDVRGINNREIAQLFPGCRITLEKIILAPPVLRRLAPYTWLGCYLLSAIPWLCTHYLGTIRKAG
jgi:ubiquinone/menaquinone biosynthesis C-methylase UbiE